MRVETRYELGNLTRKNLVDMVLLGFPTKICFLSVRNRYRINFGGKGALNISGRAVPLPDIPIEVIR